MENTEFSQPEVEQSNIPPTALEWYEEPNNDEIQKKTRLYDISESDKGSFLRAWTGKVPELDEIANIFRAGKYKLIVRWTDENGIQKTKTPRFSVSERGYGKHRSYDEYLQEENGTPEAEQLSGGAAPVDIASQVSAGITAALGSIVGTVSPFLPSLIELLKPKPLSNEMEEFRLSQIRMNEIQTKQNNKIFNEAMKTGLDTLNANYELMNQESEVFEDEEEDESPMSMIFQMVKPILSGAMPTIMNGQGAELFQQIKNNPLYLQLVNSETAMKEVQAWVLDQFGVEALTILNGLMNS